MNRRLVAIAAIGLAVITLLLWATRLRTAGPGRGGVGSAGDTTSGESDRTGSDRLELSGKPPANETRTERRARMLSDSSYREDFKLSEQDIYLFVQAKGSNALSLVAAFESTRDNAYLKAAADKHPSDPFVQAKALMWLDMTDDQRAKIIDDFKKSSPTNSFANFMAARDAVKRGDTQAALAELAAARGKGYEEYFRESVQGLEEAYLSAGHAEADAKVLGSSEITLPHLAQFKSLGKHFLDLAEKAGAAGDMKTQQEMVLVNWEIGQKLRSAPGSVPIITEMVGIAMENAALRALPTDMVIAGRSPTDHLQANAIDRGDLRSVGNVFGAWFPTASDEEIITYMNTLKSTGERDALKWLTDLHPHLKSAKQQPN